MAGATSARPSPPRPAGVPCLPVRARRPLERDPLCAGPGARPPAAPGGFPHRARPRGRSTARPATPCRATATSSPICRCDRDRPAAVAPHRAAAGRSGSADARRTALIAPRRRCHSATPARQTRARGQVRERAAMTGSYDLAIVGGSFAGLVCARSAALRGLRTVVLERQPAPGHRMHTTGLLVKEVAERLEAAAAPHAPHPRRAALRAVALLHRSRIRPATTSSPRTRRG